MLLIVNVAVEVVLTGTLPNARPPLNPMMREIPVPDAAIVFVPLV